MKKAAFLALALAIILVSAQSLVLAGEVSGRTFVATEYKSFKITVPKGWKIMDMEDEEPDENLLPVFELKRKKALNGKKPTGNCQAVKAKIDAAKYTRDFANELKKAGMKITKQARITINGKEAYEVQAVMIVGTFKIENRWFIMSGQKYLYMLNLSEANDPVFDNELSEMTSTIEYM